MNVFLLILVCALSSLSSDLADHLREVTQKSLDARMRNIDFIYMINLDERPEKFEVCRSALAEYGIVPHRFSAVNGWTLPLELVQDVGLQYEPWMTSGMRGTRFPPELLGEAAYEEICEVGKTYFHDHFFLGSIGCAISHVSILQDAYDSGYRVIWVMEDDIEILRDPRSLSDLIDRLESLVGEDGWDILFTDRDTKSKKGEYVECKSFSPRPDFTPQSPERFAQQEMVGSEFRRVGARYGTYSMLIHRSGITKLLQFMKAHQVFLPYDFECTLPNDIRLYTVLEDVVSTQPCALSDNGEPNYKGNYD